MILMTKQTYKWLSDFSSTVPAPSDSFQHFLFLELLVNFNFQQINPPPLALKKSVSPPKGNRQIFKYLVRRQVRDAPNARNKLQVADIQLTPIRFPVPVYRSEKYKREGLFSLLKISGENMMMLTSIHAVKFISTVVKTFF